MTTEELLIAIAVLFREEKRQPFPADESHIKALELLEEAERHLNKAWIN